MQFCYMTTDGRIPVSEIGENGSKLDEQARAFECFIFAFPVLLQSITLHDIRTGLANWWQYDSCSEFVSRRLVWLSIEISTFFFWVEPDGSDASHRLGVNFRGPE